MKHMNLIEYFIIAAIVCILGAIVVPQFTHAQTDDLPVVSFIALPEQHPSGVTLYIDANDSSGEEAERYIRVSDINTYALWYEPVYGAALADKIDATNERLDAIVALIGTGGGAVPDSMRVRINFATVEELQRIPGVGPVIAGRIRQYVESVGYLTSMDQLVAEITGVGPAKAAEMYVYVDFSTEQP